MIDLQETFEYVREAFFARWDRKEEWKVKKDLSIPSDGVCDKETKTIIVGGEWDSEEEVLLLLIHEICHAYSLGHGKKWQSKFLEKAGIAREIGRYALAEEIEKHVKSYRDAPKVRAEEIYNQLADWTFERPEIPYDEMIRMVAASLGIYPEEFKKKYKRSRRVYDQAKKDAEADPIR